MFYKKKSAFILLLGLLIVQTIFSQTNKWYPVNRAPLKQTKFVVLPCTVVKPDGWLKAQLEVMADGLTGNLYRINPNWSQWITNSKWRGGDGDHWERGPYYCDGLFPLAYLTNNQRLIDEVEDKWVKTMLQHKNDWFDNEQGDQIWACTIAWKALRSWFEATGEQDTTNFYALTRTYLNLIKNANWGGDSWSWNRAHENYLFISWFHRRTGESWLPDVAKSVKDRTMNWTNLYNTMRYGSYDLTRPNGWRMDSHVVNHGMALKQGSTMWQFPCATRDDSLAAHAGVINMNKYHGQVAGRISGDESIAGPQAWHGGETCSIVEQMYSYENMIEIFGVVDWADRLEMITYNHLPGQLTADGWNRQYHGQVNQVISDKSARSWMSSGPDANLYGNFDCLYGCCTSDLHQGWPKFAMHTWMATHDNGLAAVVYAPSVIKAKVGSSGQEVTINEITDYPFKNEVKFKITTASPVEFPLVMRVPKWGKGMTVTAPSGATIEAPGGGSATSGLNAEQWVKVIKTWNNNEEVVVKLPFKPRFEYCNSNYPNRDNKDIAIYMGPICYTLKIKQKFDVWWEYPAPSMGAICWKITPESNWNYALVLDTLRPENCFEVEYKTVGAKYPWGQKDEPVYDEAQNKHVPLDTDIPVVLTARAKRVSNWGIVNNSAGDPPKSPMNLSSATEEVELVPYGSCRLRIATFPWVYEEVVETRVPNGIPASLFSQSATLNRTTFRVNKPIDHTIDIVTLSGRNVKSFSGSNKAQYMVSRGDIASGLYVVRVRVGSLKQAKKMLIH